VKVSHYLVRPGLFAGEYPGHADPDTTRSRLLELASQGVQTYIDLTTPQDRALGLQPYDVHFEEIHAATGINPARHSFGIVDMGLPSDLAQMRSVLDLIHQELAAGRTCYVHCWGGIGRTGTVVGCWLREMGLDGESALAEVQRLYSSHMPAEKLTRNPNSPQRPAQMRYVRNWR
jgi:predicted protein tyrosine phosphatase